MAKVMATQVTEPLFSSFALDCLNTVDYEACSVAEAKFTKVSLFCYFKLINTWESMHLRLNLCPIVISQSGNKHFDSFYVVIWGADERHCAFPWILTKASDTSKRLGYFGEVLWVSLWPIGVLIIDVYISIHILSKELLIKSINLCFTLELIIWNYLILYFWIIWSFYLYFILVKYTNKFFIFRVMDFVFWPIKTLSIK